MLSTMKLIYFVYLMRMILLLSFLFFSENELLFFRLYAFKIFYFRFSFCRSKRVTFPKLTRIKSCTEKRKKFPDCKNGTDLGRNCGGTVDENRIEENELNKTPRKHMGHVVKKFTTIFFLVLF